MPTCISLPHRPVAVASGARGSSSIRSAEQEVLVVHLPSLRTAMQNRAFSIVSPMVLSILGSYTFSLDYMHVGLQIRFMAILNLTFVLVELGVGSTSEQLFLMGDIKMSNALI